MGTSIKSLFVTLFFLALSIISATRTFAQSEEQIARSAFRLGNAHYENGEFVEAAAEFEKAYKYSGKSQLLYNLYLAYRDANLPEKAADSLRRFLNESQDVPNREQLEAKLRALEKGLEKEKEKQKPPVVVKRSAKPEQKPAEPPKIEPAKAAEPAKVEPIEEQPVAVEPAPEQSDAAQTRSDEPSDDNYLPLISYIMMGTGGGMVIGSIITGIATAAAQSKLED